MIKSGKNEINRTSLTQKNAYFSKVRKKERTPKSNSQLYKKNFHQSLSIINLTQNNELKF